MHDFTLNLITFSQKLNWDCLYTRLEELNQQGRQTCWNDGNFQNLGYSRLPRKFRDRRLIYFLSVSTKRGFGNLAD